MPRLLVALLLAAVACGITPDWTRFTPRPAESLPAAFTPPALPADPAPGDYCLSPLTDPRDGTRLTMERAGKVDGRQVGDYVVEGSRYGVGERELLRVDCGTWVAVGVVSR